jgi:phosphoglycolate phosphatase
MAVFDVDGTLLDTTEGVLSSVKYTIAKHGLDDSLPDSVLQTFIGPPIQDSFARTYGLEGEILQELATTFRGHYKDIDLFKAIPYGGIYDVFKKLNDQNIMPAIATYKRQDYAESILRHFGFHNYTDILYGGDNENKLKKQDIIKKCLHAGGITNYKQAVMIGDSDNDAIGASNLGIPFIGVTYGFGFKTKEDVLKFPAIGVANTPTEVLDYLL